jgi:hypothetical protein
MLCSGCSTGSLHWVIGQRPIRIGRRAGTDNRVQKKQSKFRTTNNVKVTVLSACPANGAVYNGSTGIGTTNTADAGIAHAAALAEILDAVYKARQSGMTAREYAMSRGVPSTLTDAEAASLDALNHQMFSDDAQNGKGTSEDEYSKTWYGEEGHVPTDSATDAAGDTDNAKATQTAEDFVEQWIESETSKDGAKKTGILNPPKPLSLNDTETRRWYLDAEAQIPKLIDRTKPLVQQSKQASALRNQIRTQAR